MNNLKQFIDYQIKGIPIRVDKFEGYSKEIISEPHFHIFEIEIQFIKEGDGYYFVKNKKYKIEKGKVLIIHRKDLHYFIPGESNSKIEKITLMMKKDIIKENIRFFKDVLRCRDIHQVYLKDRDFLISELLLEEIWGIVKKEEKIKNLKTIFKLYLSTFFCILQKNLENMDIVKKEEITFAIQRAIELINKNYNRKIMEEDICKELNLSKYYFSHLFKKTTGISFKEYLVEKRLFESEKLLKFTDLKIETISTKCGFSNPSLFFRMFKKKFNITPNQLRKKVKQYTEYQEQKSA